MTSGGHLGPDWVMLGVPQPDGGVTVYASNDLTRAELETVYEESDPFSIIATPSFEICHIELAATARTVVVVRGDNYADALRRLLEHWTPEPAGTPKIGPGQRALRPPAIDPQRPHLKLTYEIRTPAHDQWTLAAGDDLLLIVHTYDDGHVEVRDARRPQHPLWSRDTP